MARAARASHDFHKRKGKRSDQILFDVLAAVLLRLEPARHPATARPRFLGFRIAVLRFHLALARLPHRAVANAICLPGRTSPLFWNGVTKGCELRYKLGSLGRARLVMLALQPIQCILLLVEG